METKKDRIIHNNIRGIGGFSIIEFLIGIFLSSILLLVGIDALTSQDKVFYTQTDIAESQHHLRIAMKRISRDIMMAGAGRPTWTTINGNDNLDFSIRYAGGVLDIVGCLDAPLGQLAGSIGAGSTTITLKTGEGARFNTNTRSDIRLGDGENAKIVGISGDTLTIDTDIGISGNQGLSYTYNANTEVYLVKWVSYSIDTSDANKPVLKMDEHQGGQAIVVGEYITGMNISISNNIVDITLTGRTKNRSKTTGEFITTELSNKVFLRNVL